MTKPKRVTQPKDVRIATMADREALFWHCHRGLYDTGMVDAGLPFAALKVLDTVTKCCNGTGGIAGIIDGPITALGSIGIRAAQMPWSDTWLLSEAWIYTDPAERKGHRLGERLMQFALWHRQDMSAKAGYDVPMEITILSTDRLEAKARFAQRYGTTVGTTIWVSGDDTWAERKKQPQPTVLRPRK